MKKCIPTLTTRGFDTNVDFILLKIFQYYVTSDYGQTLTYYGKVKSLKNSLKEAGYQPEESKEIIFRDLTELMNSYFGSDGSVSVDIKKYNTGENKIMYKIIIELRATVNNEVHSLNNEIETSNFKDATFNDYLDYLLQGGFND